MCSDNYIDVEFRAENLDRYWIRVAIRSALIKAMSDFKGRLLDCGCGRMPYKEFIVAHSAVTHYIGLDIENALEYGRGFSPDKTWDGSTMPFTDGSFETVLGTEVLEHCANPDQVLKEIWRVLGPDGLFFFTVPFLWNLHEVPHDEYRYTPFALERHLSQAGFREVHIEATGGWHASMAQMLGLWVRRSPMGSGKRRCLSCLAKPLIAYLIKKDSVPRTFTEGSMITGLYGTARK